MTHGRFKIIYNPSAGQGRAGERVPETEALLAARGIAYDLVLTKAPGHAMELAREAGSEGYSCAVAAGGDGTVNEVINGLMASKTRGDELPSMGVLSVGRGNDFAYGADVPAGLAACVDILVDGLVRPMDVGLVTGGDYPGGRHFGNGIGIGFDTIVGLEAAKMKRVHGFMSYVLGAVKTFAAFPEAPAVRVAFDCGAVEQRSHQISIMNGKRMGGTFFMAPQAVNHDGLLDLCMAERLNRREMVGLILRYTKGSQAGHPKIRIERSRRIEISAPEGGLVVHADGETICIDGRSIVAECLPSQIGIRCLPGPEAP